MKKQTKSELGRKVYPFLKRWRRNGLYASLFFFFAFALFARTHPLASTALSGICGFSLGIIYCAERLKRILLSVEDYDEPDFSLSPSGTKR